MADESQQSQELPKGQTQVHRAWVVIEEDPFLFERVAVSDPSQQEMSAQMAPGWCACAYRCNCFCGCGCGCY